jgi:hypothetical protein
MKNKFIDELIEMIMIGGTLLVLELFGLYVFFCG